MANNQLNSKEIVPKSETGSRISLEQEETPFEALKQMIIPFVLSGFGNLGAALILSSVELWPVFINVPQLNALVPPLLGLKGNVELTLASRLSTHANLGHLKHRTKQIEIFSGNLFLVQFQACIVGFCAPLIVVAIDFILLSFRSQEEYYKITWNKFLIIVASSVITTNVASIILSVLLYVVIYISKIKLKINPDNIASPIAASCGDVLTMALLAILSNFIYNSQEVVFWILISLTVLFILLTPFWALMAYRNKYTQTTFLSSFSSIIVAMIIQVISGFILENAVNYFTMFGVYQIILTGFGGDLVSVQCSRHSTYLHRTSVFKKLPASHANICITPWSMFFHKNTISRFAFLQVFVAAPSQIPFLFITIYVEKYAKTTFLFFLIYSITSTMHVIIILYLAFCFVQLMWIFGSDPDNSAIPVMTAIADFVGSILLTVAFLFLWYFDDPNAFKVLTNTTIVD